MPVSEVCVLAIYDLASMYFTSFACSIGTTKFCKLKSEKTIIILLMRKLRQIYNTTCIQFLFDNYSSFRKLNYLNILLLQHTAVKRMLFLK